MSNWDRVKAGKQVKASKYNRAYIAKYCGIEVGTLNHYLSNGKNKFEPSSEVIRRFNDLMASDANGNTPSCTNNGKSRQTQRRA